VSFRLSRLQTQLVQLVPALLLLLVLLSAGQELLMGIGERAGLTLPELPPEQEQACMPHTLHLARMDKGGECHQYALVLTIKLMVFVDM
jgi:hypothetical protein